MYCANLPYLALRDLRPPKTPNDVYVPLKMRPQPGTNKGRSSEEQERLEREALIREPLSIVDVMQQWQTPHVLILGEPGAGKSTLLRQFSAHAWAEPNKIGLSEAHLPLLVPLRLFAKMDGPFENCLRQILPNELKLIHEMPAGFFEDWPMQVGGRWIILLDALDEVPIDLRERLLRGLKQLLPRLRGQRLVLTSRATAYEDDFDESVVRHYSLLPFDSRQLEIFAQVRLEEKATGFLNAIQRYQSSDVFNTPLLLTLAAQIYERENQLPLRRVALYEKFVSTWLQEAKESGLHSDLVVNLKKVTRASLERIARTMTEEPNSAEIELLDALTRLLSDVFKWHVIEACFQAEHLLEVLSRRSAVFIRQGENYNWTHSTFREYLPLQKHYQARRVLIN